mmetsp:Transcript_66554/g.198071  ORF Transcript_66554/g.198071 Transcript_66554/m.198071 type:complete len:204 (-) Transcript_66554:231-842(-)
MLAQVGRQRLEPISGRVGIAVALPSVREREDIVQRAPQCLVAVDASAMQEALAAHLLEHWDGQPPRRQVLDGAPVQQVEAQAVRRLALLPEVLLEHEVGQGARRALRSGDPGPLRKEEAQSELVRKLVVRRLVVVLEGQPVFAKRLQPLNDALHGSRSLFPFGLAHLGDDVAQDKPAEKGEREEEEDEEHEATSALLVLSLPV